MLTHLVPGRSDGWLVAGVQGANLLDLRTRSTIESGLPGTLVLLLAVEEEGGRIVAVRETQRTLELDLWEGTLQLREGDRVVTYFGLAAADSAWSSFQDLRLVQLRELRPGVRYRLHAELMVRPLGVEDRRRVSRWVSRREEGQRRELSLDLGGLLQHFVGRAARGDQEVNARLSSEPFRVEDLLEESSAP